MEKPMRQITVDTLEDIALGAAVLGTGGGGDPYVGKLLARAALREYGPVDLLDPADLADDAFVIPTAMMGAPTVMNEKLPRGDEILTAFAALERHFDRPATATMAMEAGGINSTLPFVVAATRRLPLVDADMMGRAFPELQMCTPGIYGVPASPMAIADEKGNSSILTTTTNRWSEIFARSLTVDMGCAALIALFPMTGKQVKETCVPRTVSLLIEIGQTIATARATHQDPIAAVCAKTSGFRIWEGKVSDVSRRIEGGFTMGDATVSGTGEHAGRDLRLFFQNEFLVARTGDEVLATTPDLITMLDLETGEPVTTEGLRYGFRVAVISLPGNNLWRTPAGLDLVGPGYYGYDIPYIPVEERVAARTQSA